MLADVKPGLQDVSAGLVCASLRHSEPPVAAAQLVGGSGDVAAFLLLFPQ